MIYAKKVDNRCSWALQYIIARGIERNKIFKDGFDCDTS